MDARVDLSKNDLEATKLLLLPFLLGSVCFLSLNSSLPLYLLGQIGGAVFFAQSFILMHEFGHRSMFRNNRWNTILGHIVSLFTFIPYYNWQEIHELHHRWTGYRDKDPTTEKTFDDRLTPFQTKLVNFCWRYSIPLFTLGYRFGIYWKVEKLRRHLEKSQYEKCLWSMIIYASIYSLFILIFPTTFFKLLPAILISFSLTDIISLSQHSHIRMLNSEGKEVSPLKYLEQIKYSRSLILPKWIGKYFIFNMNHHEAHHAYPGLPCYRLEQVHIQNVNDYPFLSWLIKVKNMDGVDFVFKSDPNRQGF